MTFWRPDIHSESSPMRVLIKRGAFIDESRGGRAVPYKIYYPDAVQDAPAGGFAPPYPLIVWSHGLGGTRDGAAFVARYVAAHGYILAHIQHDGTDDSLWRNEKDIHPWDAIRAKMPVAWEVVRDRYLDVSFALDSLIETLRNDPDIGPILDLDTIGMSGHSFGALTTQAMAGQAVGRAVPEFFTEPRFKAGILYSPVPNFRVELPPQEIYGPISIPLLHMTGTNDVSPVEGFGYDKRVEVWEHANGPDQHLIIIDGADHMVFNGSRGQLPDYPDLEADKNVISMTSLAWWDAFLKDDAAAMAWLKGEGVQNWLGRKAEYMYKNG